MGGRGGGGFGTRRGSGSSSGAQVHPQPPGGGGLSAPGGGDPVVHLQGGLSQRWRPRRNPPFSRRARLRLQGPVTCDGAAACPVRGQRRRQGAGKVLAVGRVDARVAIGIDRQQLILQHSRAGRREEGRGKRMTDGIEVKSELNQAAHRPNPADWRSEHGTVVGVRTCGKLGRPLPTIADCVT